MASRFLLRAGASVASRSARGHLVPAGLIWTPQTVSPLGALSDAGCFAARVPALKGLRHYGTPFNRDMNIAELNEALRKVQKRLGALEEKCYTYHKSSINDTFNKYKPHRKDVGSSDAIKQFRQLSNVIMFVGYGFTVGTVLYYNLV
ncbi:hypothetical protein EJB05_39121 [Eragrostis curvula]|uniref:Uncharacterized protein n=1 Tax=Eragrostis curvula TaxID=38414 RepID=A0A5J9TY15_9POAL|nr:hypothetical protein EJB05_39121 [Eragrostis curvula]